MSILIAWALLLSAARNANAQSLGPSQGQAQQGNDTTQQDQTYSGQWMGHWTANTPSAEPSAENSRQNRNQYPSTLWKVWEWITNISTQAFFTFITALATVILAIFTGQLVCVTRDLHKATEAATKVAMATDRPFLFSFSGWVKQEPIVSKMQEFRCGIGSISCDIQNFGKGPAVISEIRARLKYAQPVLPSPARFDDCLKIALGQKVIPPGERTNFIVRLGSVSPNEVANMYDENVLARLYCYGIICYCDIHGNPGWTTFGFQRIRGRSADEKMPGWLWVMGPEEYNRIGLGRFLPTPA